MYSFLNTANSKRYGSVIFLFVFSKINILCARACITEPVLAILARQNSTENECIEENAVCISLIHAGINLLSILSSCRVME